MLRHSCGAEADAVLGFDEAWVGEQAEKRNGFLLSAAEHVPTALTASACPQTSVAICCADRPPIVQYAPPAELLARPADGFVRDFVGADRALKRLRDVFPAARPYLMYGLTEAFRSTFLPPEELERRPDSMGKAIPNRCLPCRTCACRSRSW